MENESEDFDNVLDSILNGNEPADLIPISELRQNVVRNDALLLELSMYKASKGQTIIVDNLQTVQDVFTELKNRIIKSGLSMEKVERDIYSQYGIGQICPKNVEPHPAIAAMLGHFSKDEPRDKNIGFGH